ncbi:MAG: hydrogenase maturation nickel metallochaperone HypA [Nitrospirota bacterium]|jgi:hydrogenase nickel incorporation protein HypA/HybF
MHECSLALGILDIAQKQCRDAGYSTIESIDVRVGSASGVLADALAFAFDLVKRDIPGAGDAVLRITDIPLGGVCAECGRRFSTTEQFILACPHCGGADFRLDAGRELDVTQIEVQ